MKKKKASQLKWRELGVFKVEKVVKKIAYCGVSRLANTKGANLLSLLYHTIPFSQVETGVRGSVTSQDWRLCFGKVRILIINCQPVKSSTAS